MTTKERPLVTEEERQRLYLRIEQLQPGLWSKLYPRAAIPQMAPLWCHLH
jgi:hypothetical protein